MSSSEALSGGSFSYHIFGLDVAADLEDPHLSPAQNPPTARVARGSVPEQLPGATYAGVCLQAHERGFLWHVPGIARCLYRDDAPEVPGGSVVVEPAPGAAPEAIRMLLRGPVWGTRAYYRGLFPIVGSCAVVDGAGILFMGDPGAGKSVAAALLRAAGGELVADGLCLIDAGGGAAPQVLPGPPLLKLWPDAARALGLAAGADPLRPGVAKLAVPLASTCADQRVPLTHVCRVEIDTRGEHYRAEPVGGQRALHMVMRSVYQGELNRLAGRDRYVAQAVTALASHVRFHLLHRPARAGVDPADGARLREALAA